MKIYYLQNSGFAVVLAKSVLVFDYAYVKKGEGFETGNIPPDVLEGKQRVYFFVSHRHLDHFNPKIFDFAGYNPNTVYILEEDVPQKGREVNAFHLKVGEKYEDGYIKAISHPSTDIGCSFQVEAEDMTIFHAGDLNCWHWTGEWSLEEEQAARQDYHNALLEIQKSMGVPDVAFFPVDPRMQGSYDEGAVEFVATFHPKLFVPMHFREKTKAALNFKEKMQHKVQVFAPRFEGDFYEM